MATTLLNRILVGLVFAVLLSSIVIGSYVDCCEDCKEDYDKCIEQCESEWESCNLDSSTCDSNFDSCKSSCQSDKFSCLSSCNSMDSDNDGVNDGSDSLIGDENNVKSKGLKNVYVEANGYNSTEAGVSSLSGRENVSFKKNGKPVVQVEMDFSKSVLDITEAEIKKQKKGSMNGLVVNGIKSNGTIEKTVYLEQENSDSSLCVADKKLEDISDISRYCEGEDEYFFSDCKSGQIQEGITCSMEDGMFKVSGLEHSGVAELNFTGLYTGYFTVSYPNELERHKDGYIMPGETARICFEAPRSIQDDEYLRLAFVPNNGMVSVNELHMPHNMRLKNVHLYP